MKENQSVKPVIDLENQTVTFEVRGKKPLVLEWDKLSPEVQMRAGLAGMAQVRIVDAAAVGRADSEGNLLSEEVRLGMKYQRMAALIEHYHTGTSEWTLRSEGGGGARSLTLEAIAIVKSVTYEDAEKLVDAYAQQKFEGDRKKALTFLSKGQRVREEMQKLRIKRAGAPKVDADTELDKI